MHDDQFNAPPEKADAEWANTATHLLGVLLSIAATIWMLQLVLAKSPGLILSCMAYMASVILVFIFSTLSHAFTEPNWRTRMRAWDQGTIYLMIAGTYTPFVWHFGHSLRSVLIVLIWLLAFYGLWCKVIFRKQVNAVTVTTYLLLGWGPAFPLAPQVPWDCFLGMALGGVIYSLGVLLLVNDHVQRFFHAGWHIAVIFAAACHYFVILKFIVNATA